MRSRKVFIRITIAVTLLLLAGPELDADEFLLETGASVRGKWLNQDDTSSAVYLVATEHGGRVALERTRVVEVVRQSESRIKYDLLAPTVADTVEGHWRIARWCRDNDLPQQCEQHLLRTIELDPQHQPARRALGFSEIGGQWVKQDEYLEQQGYVRYKGKWQLVQEIELAEQRRAEEIAKKQWFVKLSRWRSQLNKEKRHTALDNIRQVRDPLAIEAMERLLRLEPDRRMRLVYVEVLGMITDDRASAVLVEITLSARDEEVFYACVDQLASRTSPLLAREFVAALKSQHNGRVNRAAIALGSLGDRSVIPPLIEALVTRHETVLPGSDMKTTTFASGGPMQQTGGTFTAGRSEPTLIARTAANQEVLKTLVKLTGVSFSFDQRAWLNWYALQQRRGQSQSVDARRID